jgi:hypothetical protein
MRLVLAMVLALGCGARSGMPPVLDTPPPGYRPLPHIEQPPYVVPQTAYEALRGPIGIVPSFALADGPLTERHLLSTSFLVNGFEASGYGCVHFDASEQPIADYELVCPIHPYFLVPGENHVKLADDEVDWAATRWDYLRSATNVELARGKGSAPGTFVWDVELPTWSWVHGVQIEDNRENFEGLLAEIERFHAALQSLADGGATAQQRQDEFFAGVRASTAEYIRASELRGKPFAFLDELRKALNGEAFGNRPPDSAFLAPIAKDEKWRLDVFAGGTLARITNDRRAPIITFTSNYSEGPWGSLGGTVLGFELWYRKDAQNKWVLDAVMPLRSTEVAQDNDTSLREREELFRHASF